MKSMKAPLISFLMTSLLLTACNNAAPISTPASPSLTQTKTQAAPENQPTQVVQPETSVPNNAIEVTTVKLGEDMTTQLNFLGTVKAKNDVKVFPQISAQVKSINVNEGDSVQQGQVLFELTGVNGETAMVETQLSIAAANLKTAQMGLSNTVAANNSSLDSSNLSLQSALNQAKSATYDLSIFDQNKAGIEDAVSILNDSLNTTRRKNELDLQSAKNNWDEAVTDLNQALDEKYHNQNSSFTSYNFNQNLSDMNYGVNLPVNQEIAMSTQQATAQQPTTEQTASATTQPLTLDQKIDQLYKQVNAARKAYQGLKQGAELSENQILSQIQGQRNQRQVLNLSQESLKNKLGFDQQSGVTDQIKLAQEAVQSTDVRNQTSFSQAQSQVRLAQLNYDLANSQFNQLKIKAPISGVVDSIKVAVGDTINPQMQLAEMFNSQNYQLQVGVNAEDADKVRLNSTAQVQIGNRFIDVPVINVSRSSDPVTKLVTVTLGLPKITLRANQNLQARLPISETIEAGQNTTSSVPLDAVIIGTEEKYVFVVQDGKALKKNVTTGQVSGDHIQIIEGLNPTDEIIVKNAKQLTNGQAVNIQNQ